MQKIIPHIWFDEEAEDAARLYTALLPGSAVKRVSRYGKAGFEQHGRPEGTVMTVEFELAGYRFAGINGGPHFRPSPAISYFLVQEHEADVERLWSALLEGGQVLMPMDAYDWSPRYGWLNDRFGVSWQISLGQRADIGGQAIAPALMFVRHRAGQAEDALELYTRVFPNSHVEGILRHDGSGPDATGTVMHAQCYLNGETFMLMDSALPHDFGFTEANSQLVLCETQDEIDHYWHALSAVPEAEACGWLKDRFGVSWQIVPELLIDMMTDADRSKVDSVTEAIMQMKKLDIARIRQAYAG
jgi:predicted 3-demethylubiquinone-9 3-methyltransferase (glyoxalase superfamily)